MPGADDVSASKPATTGKPAITLEQALSLQKELYSAFSDQDFQDELEEVEAKHGKGYANLTRHHTELFLSVQNKILPKYGYDHGQRGVAQMFQDVSRWNSNAQFQQNRFMLNQLLGLLSPEEEESGEDQEDDDEQGVDCVEISAHHFIEDVTVKVMVPTDATFYNVREALSKQVGNWEILDKGRLMKKHAGVFSAYNDRDHVGDVRDVLLLNASLCKQHNGVDQSSQKKSEEEARSGGPAPLDRTRFMYSLSCPPMFLAERRLKGESQAEAAPAPTIPELRAGWKLEPKPERRLERKLELRPEPRKQQLEYKPEPRPLVSKHDGVQTVRARQGDKRLLVLGGDDGSSFHDSAEILEAATMTFIPGPQMCSKRSACAVATIRDGRLLVAGGCVGAKCLDTTEIFNLEIMAFEPGPNMGVRRAACAAAQLDDRRLLVLGGRDRSARLETTEILDVGAMAFSPGPRMAVRRAMCAAVALGDRRLLAIGGHDGAVALDSTEVLDLDAMEFEPGPRLGAPRMSCAAVALDDRRVLVLGGVSDSSSRLNTTEVLSLGRGTFAPGPRMGIARSGCGVMALDSQRLLVLGGHDGSNRHDTTEVLNLSSMEFTPGPKMNCRRGGCAAASC
eukprot:CAMPEP_0179046396 /NCGR_PEP_ID=MMETSP0796-20121207/18666_1 /TAXON_ID=73915 /ORGANISM="Pyrodinium bahamense, Strain pbaha01" /LENGTH=620 /DNA_ID=CAMNT_0020742821 /DNA_START=149 /DNA_END=2011 /DNA_ORIENTATION=-